MTIATGLGHSKKFSEGTIHENGSGKFQILDRYIENNIIILKYQWLSGETEGQIDINKEANINASIWKFQKHRGLLTKESDQPITTDMSNIEARLDMLMEILNKQQQVIEDQNIRFNKLMEKIIEKM